MSAGRSVPALVSPTVHPTPELSVGQRLQRAACTALGRIPTRVLRRVTSPTVNADGDVMAPEIAVMMKLAASGPDFSKGTVAQARDFFETDCRVVADETPGVEVDTSIVLPGGCQASYYRPRQRSGGLVIFFHGGGFVLGSRDSYDAPARILADRAGVDVLSVEYRLAPEAKYPAPIEDAHGAWGYAVEHAPQWGIDIGRIAVLGDSAGANIAAVLCNEIGCADVRPALQVLMYPVIDLAGEYRSRTEFRDSPALSVEQISWFADHYLPEIHDPADPRLSPVHSADLADAPPTLITVAGFDPLRDEAIVYADRLRAHGVPTRLLREGDLVHGYISMTLLSPAARAAVDRVTDAISRALRASNSTEQKEH